MQRFSMAGSARWSAGVYLAVVLAAAGAWALGAAAGVTGSSGTPWARGSERARVARAVDGDTVVLEDGRTVRLLGLDAPETRDPGLAGPQPLGVEAANRLAGLTVGREVVLEREVTDADHYGRLLRHVWLGRALVAEAMLAEGLARSNVVPPDVRHRDCLRAAEERARRAGAGLWGLPRPTPLAVFDADRAGADGH